MISSIIEPFLAPLRRIGSHLRTLWKYRETYFAFPVNAVRCHFEDHVKVYSGTVLSNVWVGRCSYIGGHCEIKNASIGKFCSIGPEVRIGLGSHPVAGVVSAYPGFYSTTASGVESYHVDETVSETRRVEIGSDVWIGQRAMVLDGVVVGHGAILAAGSIVTQDVEPFDIVGGVPAKVIRSRVSKDERERLLASAWWDWPDDRIQAAARDMQDLQVFLNRWSPP